MVAYIYCYHYKAQSEIEKQCITGGFLCRMWTLGIKLLALNKTAQAVDRFSQGRRMRKRAAATEVIKEKLSKGKL